MSAASTAYGKLTGRPAACLSLAGPGATNLLTGLWDANVDRAPVLALTGQVDTQVLGPGAFQEVDLQAAFGKVAQWSQPVLHTSRHAELVNLACKSAILNRGVSHLIFPDEVQKLPAKDGEKPGGPEGCPSASHVSYRYSSVGNVAARQRLARTTRSSPAKRIYSSRLDQTYRLGSGVLLLSGPGRYDAAPTAELTSRGFSGW